MFSFIKMMKILFMSSVMLIMPASVQITLAFLCIFNLSLTLNFNNITFYNEYMNTDLISISLMLLSLWILVLMKLSQFNSKFVKSLFFMFVMLNLSLMFSFSSNSILLFYLFFEWSLIPIFFIIMGWGYQMERLKSSFYLLMYTLFASLPLLMMILTMKKFMYTLNMNYLMYCQTLTINNVLMMFTFLAFLVKFPMFFFHQWLPKAHVEAPVGGSMILAGLLLKLGGYGIIRLLSFVKMSYIMKFILMFSLIGGSLLSVLCLMNSDMKVMIAYSSVVHMAMIIVTVFLKNLWSLNGSMIIMVAHGVCSSGMFSCANMMYERTHSRMIMMNKSNLNYSPSLAIFWFLLCMANFGGPFTYNLLGEIVLIISLSSISYYLLSFIFMISFFSAAYSIILYSNLQQGINNNLILSLNLFTAREMIILVCHLWPLLIMLVNPMLI